MDLQQAKERVRAIRAAMETLIPGSTNNRPALHDGFLFTPASGDDGWFYDVSVGSSGGGRYFAGEWSWNPRIGPISVGAAAIPEDEPPIDTARRLLKC